MVIAGLQLQLMSLGHLLLGLKFLTLFRNLSTQLLDLGDKENKHNDW